MTNCGLESGKKEEAATKTKKQDFFIESAGGIKEIQDRGYMSGSTTRKEMLDYMERNTLHISPLFMEYPSYEKLNIALAEGDIDIFCVDTCILKGYLNQNRKILPEHFSPQDYGIGASKEIPELIDAANKVLSELNYLKISLF